MAYTFADAKAKGRRTTQFFDIMGSRGIYHDGWFACTFGPRTPWVPGLPKGIAEWSPEKDIWELYNLDEDWSQADDLAAKMPEKLAEMKNLFLVESTKNKNLPIGGGLWTMVLHPEDAPATPYTEWTFSGPITRMPEFTAPKLGKFDNTVSMDVDVPENANGVLYALGGFSGGLTCYVKDGVLCYEYNLFEIQRTQIKAKEKLPAGKVKIEVESKTGGAKTGVPDGRHPQGQRQGRGARPGAGDRRCHVHRERLPRHRQRPRFAGVAGLLRPGPVPVQRHHRHDEDRVSEEIGPLLQLVGAQTDETQTMMV